MKFLLIYVPNLRFSFEKNWCTSTIGENFKLSSGLTPSTKEKVYFNNGIIPWINSGELKNKYISSTENRLTLNAVKKHNLTIYPKDTMVIAIYGLEAAGVRGKASITKMDSTISQSCMALNSLGDVLTQFMYYVYKKEAQILGTRYAQGTKQQNLSSDLLSSYKLLYPSKEEQLKIVNFLSLIDEKIETQIKIINDYKSLKKWINDKIYSDLKCEYLSFSSVYVIAKEGGTPSTTKPEYYSGNIPFIKIDDLNKKYITENKVNISEQGLSNSSAWIIPKNSVIMSNGATIGNVSINTYPVSTKQGILGIVPKDDVLTEYLYYLLNTTDFRRNLKQVTTKGTIDCAYIKDIDHIKVKIPELEIQKSIIQILKRIDKKIELEVLILDFINKQKQYLLNNLFV